MAWAKDALISAEGVPYFIDLTSQTSNVAQTITAAQLFDFSFLDRARKELRSKH